MKTLDTLIVKVLSLKTRVALLGAPEGKWITVNGHHIFISKGQSLDDALKSGLF